MQLKWGAFAHSDSECSVSITRTQDFDKGGRRTGHTETWHIAGFLQADDPGALTSRIQAMKAAYADDGRDLILFLNGSGGAGGPSAHSLISGASITGTMVTEGPNFEEGKGAEYSYFRTFSITVEAKFLDKSAKHPTNAIEFNETFTRIGTGGPRFIFLQPIVDPPQKQFVAQSTPVKATQTGNATGRNGYVAVPAPIFPGDEHQDQRQISEETPQRVGPPDKPTGTDYKNSWSYQFEAVGGLNGHPHPFPEGV